MNTNELENAFQGALKEVRDDVEGFAIAHIAAMTSLLIMRAAMETIKKSPEDAVDLAEYALDEIESFSPVAIAKHLGRSPEGPLN